MFKCTFCQQMEKIVPWPTDAIFFSPTSRKDTVGMWVKLNAITLLVPPFIFLVGVVEVQITGKLFAKAKSGSSLSFVLRLDEFGLDDEILGTPGICEVD